MSQRNRGSSAAALVLGALLLVGLGAGAEEGPSLELRGVERRDGGVAFSFGLAGGLPEDLVKRLDEGERVTVTYEAEVVRDRRFWFNSTMGRRRLELAAQLDPVTRRYTLEKRLDRDPAEVAEAGARESAVAWLTSVDELLVPVEPKKLEAPRIVWRARAILARRLVMLFVPTTVKSPWEKGRLALQDERGGEGEQEPQEREE